MKKILITILFFIPTICLASQSFNSNQIIKLPILDENGELTIAGWGYSTNLSGVNTMLGNNNGISGSDYDLDVSSSKLRVGWGNTVNLLTGSTTIATNTWYHFAFTRAGATSAWTIKAYINCIQDGSNITTAVNPNGSNEVTSIGQRGAQTSNWVGLLSDVRIWNRVLEKGEICEVYRGHYVGRNLEGSWPLLATGNIAIDVSGKKRFGQYQFGGVVPQARSQPGWSNPPIGRFIHYKH